MGTVPVMTYNVRHCRGMDGIVDVARTGEVLRKGGARLIALQELDLGMERSGRTDQPDELAAATGLKIHFHATIERGSGRYGIGLASEDDLEVRAMDLPRRAGEEKRAVLVAHWRGFHVLSTHLSRDRAARRIQISFLAGLVSETPGPVVLLGDLNQGTRGLGPLHSVGLKGPRLPTHPARLPLYQRDYVLAGRGAEVASARAIATRASDHLPVVAEIGLSV